MCHLEWTDLCQDGENLYHHWFKELLCSMCWGVFFLFTINLKHKPSRKTFVWWKPVSPPPHLAWAGFTSGHKTFLSGDIQGMLLYFLYKMDGVLFQPVHLIAAFLNEWSYFLPLPILPPCKFWKRQILFTLSWDSLPQMAHLCLGMPSGWPVGRHSRAFEGHLVYTLPFSPSLFRVLLSLQAGLHHLHFLWCH